MEKETANRMAQEPLNVLFDQSTLGKRDIWEIDLIKILDMLIAVLEKAGKKDFRIAGFAAASSSKIYKMKVDSIFALQRAAMEKKPMIRRDDIDIELVDIPYRHESTYPVTLDELLGILENLIGTIANPQSRRKAIITPIDPPDFEKVMVPSFETMRQKYEDLIVLKIQNAGYGLFSNIVADLNSIDTIRCFFAILFLARDKKIEIAQQEADIQITLIGGADSGQGQ